MFAGPVRHHDVLNRINLSKDRLMKSEEYAEMMKRLKKARCLKRVLRILLLARVVRSDNECLPLLQ